MLDERAAIAAFNRDAAVLQQRLAHDEGELASWLGCPDKVLGYDPDGSLTHKRELKRARDQRYYAAHKRTPEQKARAAATQKRYYWRHYRGFFVSE